MVDMMQCVLSDYVYEKTSERESVEYEVSLQLTTDPNENTHPVVEGNITRPDCAVASLCYEFKFTGKWNPTPPIPKLFLVARAKPEKHHNKAGNINNCIYNQKLKGDFVAFLDNDMKPKPNFIFRTLPWFFLTNGKYVPEEVIFLCMYLLKLESIRGTSTIIARSLQDRHQYCICSSTSILQRIHRCS